LPTVFHCVGSVNPRLINVDNVHVFLTVLADFFQVSATQIYDVISFDNNFPTTPKTRNREPLKPVDNFDRCAIRNKIHEFYTVHRQLPTIAKLHESLKDDIKFNGSVSLLRNIVLADFFQVSATQIYDVISFDNNFPTTLGTFPFEAKFFYNVAQ
jgi:NADH:ubiquinone oxidoreductase subunit E